MSPTKDVRNLVDDHLSFRNHNVLQIETTWTIGEDGPGAPALFFQPWIYQMDMSFSSALA